MQAISELNMRYTKILLPVVVALMMMAGCGQSYEETKRITRQQRLKMLKEDSAALKIAVMPTLDCLPLYLAKDHQLFDTVVDIRLKRYTAQMDIDTALTNRRVELGVTDLVRAERMKNEGVTLDYVTSTNAYWQLVSNRVARITDLKHLDDKMLAMTRYSVTDMLAELAVDSAKLKPERVFRIQVNDVHVRLKMLENNEMDALFLPEPQAAQARMLKHKVLLDSRKMDVRMGAIVVQGKGMDDKNRRRQMEVFTKGYQAACDSINKFGIQNYRSIIMNHCKVKSSVVDSISSDYQFPSSHQPLQKDVERATNWLKRE